MDDEKISRQLYMMVTVDKVFQNIIDEEDYNFALELMANFWAKKSKTGEIY